MEKVRAEYLTAKGSYDRMIQRRNKQRLQLDGFQVDLDARKKKQKRTRKLVEQILRRKFRQYMHVRGHHGTLSVDYKERTLNFDVTVIDKSGCMLLMV